MGAAAPSSTWLPPRVAFGAVLEGARQTECSAPPSTWLRPRAAFGAVPEGGLAEWVQRLGGSWTTRRGMIGSTIHCEATLTALRTE